jgi:hypothetical protein
MCRRAAKQQLCIALRWWKPSRLVRQAELLTEGNEDNEEVFGLNFIIEYLFPLLASVRTVWIPAVLRGL